MDTRDREHVEYLWKQEVSFNSRKLFADTIHDPIERQVWEMHDCLYVDGNDIFLFLEAGATPIFINDRTQKKEIVKCDLFSGPVTRTPAYYHRVKYHDQEFYALTKEPLILEIPRQPKQIQH